MPPTPRRRPTLHALLAASVAAGALPAEALATPAAVPDVSTGNAPGGRDTAARPLLAAAPDNWLAGRQYAANLTGDVVNDSSPDREPVTREYERYAALTPAPFGIVQGAVPDGGPSILTPDAPVRYTPAAPLSTAAGSRIAAANLPPPQSMQTAQLDSPASLSRNPFRPDSLTPDEPSAAATLRSPLGSVAPVVPADPLTADINRELRQVSADLAPHLDASVSLRGRSGEPGLAQLFDLEAPVEASFSPNGYGRLRVVVTPTVLAAGHPNQANARLFGTNPLLQTATTVAPVPVGHTSTAVGAALDVGYAYGIVSGDVGSSPLGFRETNVVGGIEVAPKLANNLVLRLTGDRRAVTDSILSYGGLRDPRSGESWGGVTRNRGRLQLEGSVGTVSYYAGAGGAGLFGSNVKSNTEVEAGAGFNLPVYTTDTQEVRTGLNLVYFAYDRNLGSFSFGNGGYFSPQQFFAALVPVTYRQQLTPDLVYTVGGSIGVQTFRAKSTNVFPNDPGLQAQLVALSATTGVPTKNAGFSDLGPGGGASGEIDYRVNDNLHIGAKAGFDRSGNFTEGTGLVYARYVFNDPS